MPHVGQLRDEDSEKCPFSKQNSPKSPTNDKADQGELILVILSDLPDNT